MQGGKADGEERTQMYCPHCDQDFSGSQGGYCPRDGHPLRERFTAGPNDPFIGTILDERFRIEELIGEGGMGSVYRATQLSTVRAVAIKLLHAKALTTPESVQRFEREARVISQLSHTNTIRLYDFGYIKSGQPYLVMELLKGDSLDTILKAGPLSVERSLQLLLDCCNALAEAHAQGIVHRDLKPGNLFLQYVPGQAQEILKVLDFGIAKELGAQSLTQGILGTPLYMSIEQAAGKELDARSDIYSLGAIIYECLSGQPPFQGEQVMSILLKHATQKPKSLREYPSLQISVAVDQLILDLLEKEPEHRPQSVVELRDRVLEIQNDRIRESLDLGLQTLTAAQAPSREELISRVEAQRSTVITELLELDKKEEAPQERAQIDKIKQLTTITAPIRRGISKFWLKLLVIAALMLTYVVFRQMDEQSKNLNAQDPASVSVDLDLGSHKSSIISNGRQSLDSGMVLRDMIVSIYDVQPKTHQIPDMSLDAQVENIDARSKKQDLQSANLSQRPSSERENTQKRRWLKDFKRKKRLQRAKAKKISKPALPESPLIPISFGKSAPKPSKQTPSSPLIPISFDAGSP